ncbi:MAG: DNA repair protein RecO [Alphaproteobacteria bacterium]|nr:DNA repair protein RecO [Alphaproteobacteria bacterium]
MEWSDHGIVLSARAHGEGDAVAVLLTAEHGRHAGLVRGGASRRLRGTVQPGNLVWCSWRARLEAHLGTFACELVQGNAAAWLEDRLRLEAMAAACELLDAALPERAPAPDAYAALLHLLHSLDAEDWLAEYVRWELYMLAEFGFGLDLSACAATGANDDLAYVSPKTGRAVSLAAGEPYRDKLLTLPRFLIDAHPIAPDAAEAIDGLRLTGYFLDRHVLHPVGKTLPAARDRLVQRLRALAGGEAPATTQAPQR